MKGIEKIIDRISGDAQAEIDAVLAQAQAEATKITAAYEAQAQAESEDILSRGAKAAAEREERLFSMAQMEGRKAELGAKQEVIEEAFALALNKLQALPEEKYVALLAALAAKASATGKETLIFSAADRDKVGKQVVKAASELKGKDAKFVLGDETRPLNGGFVLSDGAVEVNCSFDTLVRLQKAEITGEVSRVLFA